MSVFFITFVMWVFGIVFSVLGVFLNIWWILLIYRLCRDVHKISIGDTKEDLVEGEDGEMKKRWIDKIFTWDFYKENKKKIYIGLLAAVVVSFIAAVVGSVSFKALCGISKLANDSTAADTTVYIEDAAAPGDPWQVADTSGYSGTDLEYEYERY